MPSSSNRNDIDIDIDIDSSSHPFTTLSANSTGGGGAAAMTLTSKAPPTKESTTTTRSSSTTSSLDTTRTSASNSSLYETLRAETASCCPICGFQILAVTTNTSTNTSCTSSSSNAGAERELTASAIASIADATTPYPKSCSSKSVQVQEHTYDDATWLRSFVIDQQEHLLKGCNNVADSSGLLATTTTTKKAAGAATTIGFQAQAQADTKATAAAAAAAATNLNFPAGTCWVCLQAAPKVEGQIEEDRKLAASLSAIIRIEEQQDCSNNNNNNVSAIHTSYGDHDRHVASLGDYGARPHTINSISYTPDNQVLLPQEWLEEGHAPISTSSSTPAAKVQRINEDHLGAHHKKHDHRNDTKPNGDNNDATANSDDPCVYIGDYNILGQRHGSHGELIWDSGDRYVGTFKNGMRSGQGSFFFRDGSEYTGDWNENQIHGRGQRTYFIRKGNFDTYVGNFHKGQRNGGLKWKYKFANGDLYVGSWEADQFHGFGRYFYADGSVLEGNFVHGAKQGKFKRQLPTEDLDILRFEDDRIVGQGVRWNAKRTKTWLLELRNTNAHGRHEDTTTTARNTTTCGAAVNSQKKNHRHTSARRILRGIGNLTRRRSLRDHQTKPTEGFPSSVGAIRNDEEIHSNHAFTSTSSASMLTSSPSSLLPLDNIVPVTPHEHFKHVVKKSARIPISRAVSIGYDCEIGTGARVGLASASVN